MRTPQSAFSPFRGLIAVAAQSLCLVAAGWFALVAMPTLAESALSAVTMHVMKKGETLDGIAKKYGVTSKAILAASKLKDPSAIKVGTKLTIPPKSVAVSAPRKQTYELKPAYPGRATFARLGARESIALQLVKKGKLVPGVLPRMSKVMRFGPSGLEHPIEARLVQQLALVSDHFGGRAFEIVSGFRPKTPTQHTAHSNHNLGRAMDFRIPGVPNEVLRDFCRTFKKSGVGYYPNSLFVHFDVREESAYWIDVSRPGEAPKYVSSTGAALAKAPDADHAADDVTGDMDPPKDPAKDDAPEATEPAPPPPAPSASAK